MARATLDWLLDADKEESAAALELLLLEEVADDEEEPLPALLLLQRLKVSIADRFPSRCNIGLRDAKPEPPAAADESWEAVLLNGGGANALELLLDENEEALLEERSGAVLETPMLDEALDNDDEEAGAALDWLLDADKEETAAALELLLLEAERGSAGLEPLLEAERVDDGEELLAGEGDVALFRAAKAEPPTAVDEGCAGVPGGAFCGIDGAGWLDLELLRSVGANLL